MKLRERALVLLQLDLISLFFSECCRTLWTIRTSVSPPFFLSHQVQSSRRWRATGHDGMGWYLHRESLLPPSVAGALAGVIGSGIRSTVLSLKPPAVIMARLSPKILIPVFLVAMPDAPKPALDISSNSSNFGLKGQYPEDHWRLLGPRDLCAFPEVFRSDSLRS